jgi:glutathione synthase/RimK-type ligase-like ATP-grasp enzyme
VTTTNGHGAARVGLATCAALPVGDPDDAALVAAFHAQDIDVHWIPWNNTEPSELGGLVDAVLIRSTWDYTEEREEFCAWLEAISHSELPIFNPAPLVHWNSDKRYLADLAAAGVPTVGTTVVDSLDQEWSAPEGFDEFVVKPSVGAGSKGAQRFATQDLDAAHTHAEQLLAVGRSVLIQPYLPSVDSGSETALIHFDGVFSHAITKGPMLGRGGKAEMVDGLYVAEVIDPRTPTAAQLEVARQVLAAVPHPGGLYARVDLIDDPDGSPVLLELEMIEPSLFFAFDPPAADRLVAAVLARL